MHATTTTLTAESMLSDEGDHDDIIAWFESRGIQVSISSWDDFHAAGWAIWLQSGDGTHDSEVICTDWRNGGWFADPSRGKRVPLPGPLTLGEAERMLRRMEEGLTPLPS